MQNNKLLSLIIILLFGLTILFSFASSVFFVVESTERAVIFRKFGGGLDKINIIQDILRDMLMDMELLIDIVHNNHKLNSEYFPNYFSNHPQIKKQDALCHLKNKKNKLEKY